MTASTSTLSRKVLELYADYIAWCKQEPQIICEGIGGRDWTCCDVHIAYKNRHEDLKYRLNQLAEEVGVELVEQFGFRRFFVLCHNKYGIKYPRSGYGSGYASIDRLFRDMGCLEEEGTE